MASLMHGTGGVDLFVRFRGTAPFVYLGTAEVTPVVEADVAYLPVMNDISGRSKPFQLVYDGETHTVTATLNRFDYAVWRRTRDSVSHSTLAADWGFDGSVERGSIQLGVGDFQLALKYRFYGTTSGTVDLPPGRLYYSAVVGAFREDPSGTRIQSIGVRFDCNNIYDATTREHGLYTEVFTSLTFPEPT